MRTGSAHISIYASVYLFLDFLMNLYCQSFDLLLAFIDRPISDNLYCSSLDFCFGNIKIARSLTSVDIHRSMHDMNYY